MRQLIVLVFYLICFSGIAQTTYPSGSIPSPRGDSAWAQYGYIRPLVLGHLVVGDTAIRPKFNGAARLWFNTGVDTAIWCWKDTKWIKVASNGSGGGGGSVVWGDITGDITNQTDLINYIDSIVSANGGVDSLYYRGGAAVDSFFYSKGGTEYFWYANPAEDRIIYGGIVTWTGTDLDYYVSACYFRKNGIYYLTNDTTVTLPPLSNPDSSRKDVFIVRTLSDTQAEATTITGTESANPVTPQIDGNTDLKLTDVTLNPNQTTGLTDTLIVYDNLSAGEFEYRSSTGVTTNFSNTTNVWRVPYSVDVSAINNNDIIGFGTETQRNALNYLGLSFFIKLKTVMPNSNGMLVSLWNNGVQVSNEIGIPFNRTNLNYQGFSVPMTTFGMTNAYFDSVRFRYAGGGAGISGMYIDFIYFQGNMNPGGPSTGGNLKWVTQGTAIIIDSLSTPTVYNISADTSLLATHHYVDSSILASGGGSTEYVVQGYGIKVDSALRVYTVRVDTSVISSKEWFYDRIDSLVATIGSGITQLTGDVTAGPGSGSQVATLATVNSNVGTFGSATQVAQVTVNGKGLTTAASNVTITPAATSITGAGDLTKTDDTNVTLTLGGTPTGSLLKSTSITAGWTGTLAATRGGTGTGTTTIGDILVGTGSNTWTKLAHGTTAQRLAWDGSNIVWRDTASGGTPIDSVYIHYNSTGQSVYSSNGGKGGSASNQNVGIGPLTNNITTTGVRNMAVGYSALALNVSGGDNTAIGTNSLAKFLGNRNVAIGTSALGNATNSGNDYNTAIGYNAAIALTSALYTTAVGAQTLNANQTGSGNTAVGYNAMGSGGTAQGQNTGIGVQALLANTGNYNVGIGYATGSTKTSGNYNIIFGNVEFLTTTPSNTLVIGGNAIRWLASDLSGASSTRRWILDGGSAGVTATIASAALAVSSTTGGFLPPVMTAAQAEAISSPAEGLVVYVNNVTIPGATITTKGWWGYDGSAWTKIH